MPSLNWGENPAITLSARPSRRRPAGVYARCRALLPANLPARVTRGNSHDSNARPAAASWAAKIVNRACGRSRLMATVASQEREPLLSLRRAHVPAQARPDLGVVLDVVRAELWVGGVPRGHRYLMTADGVLELLFQLGAAEKKPPGRRVIDAVAERSVEPPPNDVDEVVVVGFDGAVVVAREGHPPPAVERNPPGEMDRLDPGQAVVVEDVPDPVVGEEKNRAKGQLPQSAGPDEAGHCEWVLRAEVLVAGHLFEVLQGRPLRERAVAALVDPEQHGPDREDGEQHRQREEEHGRNGDHVEGLMRPEEQRRWRWWLRRPGQIGPPGDVGVQVAADLGGGAPGVVTPVEIVLQLLAQPRLPADLRHPAPYGVHIEGAGPDPVPAQPGDPLPAPRTRPRVPRAMLEGLVNALLCHAGQLGQVKPQRRVHLAHEDQARRNRPAFQVGRLLQQVEPGEVETPAPGEAERRFAQALLRGLSEPVTKFGHPVCGDGRPDRDPDLVRDDHFS